MLKRVEVIPKPCVVNVYKLVGIQLSRMTNYSRNPVENPAAANSDLRHLVRATSQLQDQVRSAVERLEQSSSSSGEPRLTQGSEHQGLEWSDGSTMMRAGRNAPDNESLRCTVL